MKPNENVAKDLSYQKMIYDKLLEMDSRYAVLFPYTNLSQDVLQGGTRLRKHPLPGVSMETYEPSTLAVGGKHDDFHPKKSRPIMEKGKVHTLSGGGNRVDIVKKVMKEKGLNLPQASKYVKEHNLYQKVGKAVKPKLLRQNANVMTLHGGKSNSERVKEAYEWKDFAKSTANDGIDLVQKATDPFKHVKNLFGGDVEGGGNKSGKISRIKKAKKWEKFARDSANDGLDLVQKAKDPFKNVKSLFGGEVKKAKRPPSQWIQFVKQYASKKGIPYKQALKEASVEYKKLKGGGPSF